MTSSSLVTTWMVSSSLKHASKRKDLGHIKHLLGIEVTQSSSDIAIIQQKYSLNILTETYSYGDQLNYPFVTRPDVTFAVSVVSKILNVPCDSHGDVVLYILS
ncbi:hypothetical protein CR513_35184, partial [Mucuna pruriens]